MQTTHTSNIKTVIFDLGKVIVDFDHMIICTKLARHSPLSPDKIYESIFTFGLEAEFDRGNISSENFYQRVKQETKIEIDMDTFKQIWTNIFTLNPGIDNILSSLKEKYRLLCLSNTNVWHFEHCRKKFPVLKSFDGFILSCNVGQSKPHPAIFEAALESAGTASSKCLYIDDVPEYVTAARNLGIRGILFQSSGQLKNDLEIMALL